MPALADAFNPDLSERHYPFANVFDLAFLDSCFRGDETTKSNSIIS